MILGFTWRPLFLCSLRVKSAERASEHLQAPEQMHLEPQIL